MAERIEITDPALKKREEQAIEQLREFAPDGVIVGIDAKKKKLAARMSQLYRDIGYESRKEMFEAFGFQVRAKGPGGRPKSVDVDAILQELERRYRDRDKAKTVEQVISENSDLGIKASTLQRELKERNTTVAQELRSRGVLRDKVRATKKPSSAPDNSCDLDQALALLKDRATALPESERPATIAKAFDLVPECRKILRSAQRSRKITKESLQEQGILRVSKSQKTVRKKEQIANSLRTATVTELCAVWMWASLPVVVRRKDENDYVLPGGIVKIDIMAETEVRESLVCDVHDGKIAVRSKPRRKREPLRAETLLYALWKAGVFSGDDFLPGAGAREKYCRLVIENAPCDLEALRAERAAESVLIPEGEGLHGDAQPSAAGTDDEFGAPDAEEAASERDEALLALQMVSVAAVFDGSTLSPELQEEVNAALENDSLSDEELFDLLERVNNYLPEPACADISGATFREHLTAHAPAFSIEVPDGWSIVENYKEQMLFATLERPFVAAPPRASEGESLSGADRVICCVGPEVDGDETAKIGIPEYREALLYRTAFMKEDGLSAAKPTVLQSWRMEGANCSCVVWRVAASQGYEFYVYPISAHTTDFLRFCFTNQPESVWEDGLELVRRMVSTLKLVEDPRCEAEVLLDEGLAGPVDAERLEETFRLMPRIILVAKNLRSDTAPHEYAQAHDVLTDQDLFVAIVSQVSRVEDEALPYLIRMIDVLEKQIELGLPEAAAQDLFGCVEEMAYQAISGVEQIEEEDRSLAQSAGFFTSPEAIEEQRARIKELKDAAFSGKNEPEKAADESAAEEVEEEAITPPEENPEPSREELIERARVNHEEIVAEFNRGFKREKAENLAPDSAHRHIAMYLLSTGGGLAKEQIESELERTIHKKWKPVDPSDPSIDIDAILGHMISPERSYGRMMTSLGLSYDGTLARKMAEQKTVEERDGVYYLWCQQGFDHYARYGAKQREIAALEAIKSKGAQAQKDLKKVKNKLVALREELDQLSFFSLSQKSKLKKDIKSAEREQQELEAQYQSGRKATAKLKTAKAELEMIIDDLCQSNS